MNKREYIIFFEKKAVDAEKKIPSKGWDKKQKAAFINKELVFDRQEKMMSVTSQAKRERWSAEILLDELLTLTYASYIVMLEYRNKAWPYEFMAFSRRIGELWEPFCKLTFEYPVKSLQIYAPLSFENVRTTFQEKTKRMIKELPVDGLIKKKLITLYDIPWGMVESGGVKTELDLHFKQDGFFYNCDFKSGFSSNEKGNTNRLLLVASIYKQLGEKEKQILFVRQSEGENNHYLQTLKKSGLWEVFCSDECYAKIFEFTGFDLKRWINKHIQWEKDISPAFKDYLITNDLIKYLTW